MTKDFVCPFKKASCFYAYAGGEGEVRCGRDVDRYGCRHLQNGSNTNEVKR